MTNSSIDSAAAAARGRFRFRDLLRLATHTLPYLKATWPDIRRMLIPLGGIALLVLALVPLRMMGTHLFIDCLLNGKPLSMQEVRFLRLDPATFVHVEALSVAARQLLRVRLLINSAVLVTLFLVIGLFLYSWFLRLRQRVEQALRARMMGQVSSMSLRFHSGSRVGDAIFRTYQDNAMITNLMWLLVQPALRAIRWVMAAGIVLALDPRLFVGLLLVTVVAWGLAAAFTPWLRRQYLLAREQSSALTSHVQETIAGIKVIKAYGAEPAFQRAFEQQSRAAFASSYRARVGSVTLSVVVFTAFSLAMICAMAYLALAATEGRPITSGRALAFAGFSVWGMAAYSYAMGQLGNGVNVIDDLVFMWSQAQDMAIGMGRAFEHADMKPEVSDAPSAIAMPAFREQICFEGVSFAYVPGRPILRDVDLTARAGTITAIVGPTGSGKSTLATLLLRLFDPDRGSIRIDGQDVRAFTLTSLRKSVSIALQENLLFGTTIRENIRFAVPEASDEQVRQAARVACADEFIEAQVDGYDTMLGERGAKLSTGQRQRLSIARAIIKDAPILILDEPTASLDAETELRVLQNLAEWGRGRAIFLITHRLSTIRRADQIVYLRDGAVIEAGSHDSLLDRRSGAYRRFVELEADPEAAAPLAAQKGLS